MIFSKYNKEYEFDWYIISRCFTTKLESWNLISEFRDIAIAKNANVVLTDN